LKWKIRKKSLREISIELHQSANEWKFAISKIRCCIFTIVSDSITEIYNKIYGNVINFYNLGTSSIAFPDCKCLEITKDKISEDTKCVLEIKFKTIGGKLVSSNEKEFIETSPYAQYAINEVSSENYEEICDSFNIDNKEDFL